MGTEDEMSSYLVQYEVKTITIEKSIIIAELDRIKNGGD